MVIYTAPIESDYVAYYTVTSPLTFIHLEVI